MEDPISQIDSIIEDDNPWPSVPLALCRCIHTGAMSDDKAPGVASGLNSVMGCSMCRDHHISCVPVCQSRLSHNTIRNP